MNNFEVEKTTKNKKLVITLKKSLSGRLKSHKETAKSLKLNKIGAKIVAESNPATLGKIRKIEYLISFDYQAC